MIPYTMRRRGRDGFTLSECVVVFAIVAVLSVLLFPVLSRARTMAGSTKCLGNLRQLGIAIQYYAQDHDGRLPGLGPTNPSVYMEKGWRQILTLYMGDNENSYGSVFLCPLAAQDPDVTPAWKNAITTQNSYGINKKFLLLSFASVKMPSEKMLITDVYSGYLSPSESFFDSGVWYVSRRHSGESTNVLWIDGHVCSARTEDLRNSKYTDPE